MAFSKQCVELHTPELPVVKRKNLGEHIEILEGNFTFCQKTLFVDKLYWVSDATPPQNITNAFFFNIDNDLTYSPFN
jgi:hypothetical protein